MRDNGCTDRSDIMKIYEPAALRLQRLAESDRERQRHITVVGSLGGTLPSKRQHSDAVDSDVSAKTLVHKAIGSEVHRCNMRYFTGKRAYSIPSYSPCPVCCPDADSQGFYEGPRCGYHAVLTQRTSPDGSLTRHD
jgi:hypothetical protein